MPLIIDNNSYDAAAGVQATFDAIFSHDRLRESASILCDQAVQEVPAHGLLYICQKEFGTVHPNDEFINVIGTSDATTCHILIVRHTGSGVICLGHCDGSGLKNGIKDMVHTVKVMSNGGPEGRMEVHIVGGFDDVRKESIKLTKSLLKILLATEEDLHLQTACITFYNDTLINDVHFPIVYGLGVNVKTGEIFRAKFPDRGPLMDVRGASHFIGLEKMVNIYEAGKGIVKIGPFSWSPWKDLKDWLNVPNSFIRKYMSTSPEQEPEHFEDSIRASLRVIHLHPSPRQTLFLHGRPLLYKLQSDGHWVHLPS